MKMMKKLVASGLLVFAIGSAAFANDCEKAVKVEAYAHPGMFSSQSQEVSTSDSVYVTGGKILKSRNHIGVIKKDRVYVDSFANDMMNLLKSREHISNFDEKMPVLRSELAVILSEGFNLKNTKDSQRYTDISSTYWAKDWINGALNAGVMIGYPDKSFRPDQPVTKAEVFATVAQLIEVPTDKSLICPDFKNKEIKYIPKWAIRPTKEVVNSEILEDIPNPDKVNNDEYLSKVQVAYLVGSLKQYIASGSLAGVGCLKNYTPTVLNIKLEDRLSARQSNIGDKFTAKTTKDVTIKGVCYPAGSLVKGEVVEVSRPGVKNPGYVKVKFTHLKNGKQCVEFPKNIAQAKACVTKNPNVVARLVGFPFSGSARIVGVAGRTAASGVNVVANGVEQFGDNLSSVFVDTASLKPVSGVKNVGNAAVTVGKGVFDICKLAVSGTYGVLYELTDEIRYVIVPQYSNEASLNPGEELIILY